MTSLVWGQSAFPEEMQGMGGEAHPCGGGWTRCSVPTEGTVPVTGLSAGCPGRCCLSVTRGGGGRAAQPGAVLPLPGGPVPGSGGRWQL